MRNYINVKDLGTQIKAGLQICSKVINKDKCFEKEYGLFISLAKLYLLKEDVREYPKVAAIYQYLHKLVDKACKDTDNKEKHEELDRNICLVEKQFIEKVTQRNISSDYGLKNLEKVREHRKTLEEYRESIKVKLKAIENLGIIDGQEELDEEGLKERAGKVEDIYRNIREFFTGKEGLINKLLVECVEELGGVPLVGEKDNRQCEYAVFGMGSLALGTMTPWSDLEFGILIEEGITKEEEVRVKEYFRNLTILLHIKVVSFGETPLRMMGIEELNNFKLQEETDKECNWFRDELTKSGFSFDGPHWHACKTPLGRINGYRKVIKKEGVEELALCTAYELIGTVNELTGFYQDASWSKEDPQLVQGLGHTVLINGNASLITNYQEKLKEHRQLIGLLAFKILKEDSQELNPFKQILDEDKEGQVLKVKKEIYRFPDRVIVALGDSLGGKGANSWELIGNTAKVGGKQKQSLQLVLSIATEIRLRTYANNGGQVEDMSAIARYESRIKELRNDALAEVFYLKDIRILYKYYCTVLELNIKISRIENRQSLEEINKILMTETESILIKGYTYKRFLRYYDAIKEFERLDYNKNSYTKNALAGLYHIVGRNEDALRLDMRLDTNEGDIAVSMNNIGGVLESLGQYEEALRYHKASLELKRRIYKKDHMAIAASMNNIGLTLTNLGKYEEAFKYHQESLEIKRMNYKGDHPDIAGSLNNIAFILENLGKYEEALNYHKRSLEMRRKIYKGDHTDTAMSLNNIGVTLESLGKFKEALEYHLDGLEMRNRIYNSEHHDVASSLSNIGATLENLSRYEEALKYYHESLEIRRKIYKEGHKDAANSLNNMGTTLEKLGKYEEALKYHRESLKIRCKIYKGDHIDVAGSLNNIAVVLESIGEYEEALNYYQKSLEMRRRIYQSDHADIAASENNIGCILENLGRYEEALKYKQSSLVIRRRVYKGDHTDIAMSLNNIGVTLTSLEKYEEALKHHQESLEMRQRIYEGDHVGIAGSLHNIGTTLERLGKYGEALKYHQESLEMRQRIYKGDHVDIANSLNNIGTSMEMLGKHEEALKYHQESLEIRRRIYKGDHTTITISLHNIGIALASLKRYEEALIYLQNWLEISKRIYGGDHIDIGTSLNNLGIVLQNLGRYEEALKYTIQSIDMLRRLLPSEHQHIKAVHIQLLSCTIFLANKELLLGDYNKALAYYANIGLKFRMEDLGRNTYSFAGQYWQAGKLNLAISCYEALSEKLVPQDRSIKHNLACMYHIKALKEKDQENEDRFKEFLSKARTAFEVVINSKLEGEVEASTYVEYSQFLLKYYHKDNKEEYSKIIGLLERAIKTNDDSSLGYNQLEMLTACEPVQELLNRQEEITVKPKILGYYLLIKAYTIHNNIELAYKTLEDFKEVLQILQTTEDWFIGYHLLEAAHKDIIVENVKEVSVCNNEPAILPSNVCSLIAEYDGSLSYDQALSFNREGAGYFKSKNYNAAIAVFSKAIGLSFTNPISEVLYNRGRAYYENVNIDEAMRDYKELLSINPNHVKAYYQLGICFKHKGNLLLAETFLKQALIKDPKLEIAQKALDEINQAMSGDITRVVQQQAIHQQSHQKY